MSEQSNKLAPKLRFPEFRSGGEWRKELLGNLCANISSGKDHSELHGSYALYGSTGVIGKTSNSSYEGTYILVARVGANAGLLTKANGKFGVTDNTLVLNLNKSENIDFVFHTLDKFGLNQMVFGSGQPLITGGQLKAFTIGLPASSEQQKIADCLSSLDDLITAQKQKVEALKQHKKGLMQQLFPAEGETVPKLRFPEFENAGEWELVELHRLGELVSGLTYSPEDVRKNGLLVLRSSNVQNGQISLIDNVYVIPSIKGANLVKPNDILICVRNGSKTLIGKNALIPEGMPICTHGAFMTIFRSQTAKFVFQLFQTNDYQKQVDGDLGATINSINGRQFLKYTFYVPKSVEKQKIANFLSSLDNLITTQIQKLEVLKIHKKTLMQQLFPNINEVN